MNNSVKLYDIDDFVDPCYGVDVSKGRNVSQVMEIMLKEDFTWTEEKVSDFTTFAKFDAVNDVIEYVTSGNDYEPAESAISRWLSGEWEGNPNHIVLTYYNGIVYFVPKEPWEYGEAEKNLTKEELVGFLQKTGELFQI